MTIFSTLLMGLATVIASLIVMYYVSALVYSRKVYKKLQHYKLAYPNSLHDDLNDWREIKFVCEEEMISVISGIYKTYMRIDGARYPILYKRKAIRKHFLMLIYTQYS